MDFTLSIMTTLKGQSRCSNLNDHYKGCAVYTKGQIRQKKTSSNIETPTTLPAKREALLWHPPTPTPTLTFFTAPDWTSSLALAPPPRPAHGPRTDITSPGYLGQIILRPGPRGSLLSLASLCQVTGGGSLADNPRWVGRDGWGGVGHTCLGKCPGGAG